MKKAFMTAAALALCVCMTAAAAGCSAASKAKNMRGDVVSEEVWDRAMRASAIGTGTSAAGVQTVAAEEGNSFQAEFETAFEATYSTEGVEGELVTIEATEVTVSMTITATVTVADGNARIAFGYEFSMDGTEALLELIGLSEEMEAKLESEMYFSSGEDAYYFKNEEGAWEKGDMYGLSMPLMMVANGALAYADCSALAGRFSEFTYSDAHKGYILRDGDDSFALGAEGAVALKIKNERLAAVWGEGTVRSQIPGVTAEGNAHTALLFSYGGQSVTLPSVS